MDKSKSDYATLRREIARQVRGRMLFWFSLGLYLLYMFGVVFRPAPFSGDSSGMVFIALVWTAILTVQGLRTFRLWGRWIDRAVQKEMIRRGLVAPAEEAAHEKPKRAARLTADGEIEYEDESEVPLRQKRGGK